MPITGDRLAVYGSVPRTVRTCVACVVEGDENDLTDAVNRQLAAIEDGGGTVVDVTYAAAAVMAPGSLIVEDRLSVLIVYRVGRP